MSNGGAKVMIKWIWDLLFTRSQWTIIEKRNLYLDEKSSMPNGVKYVLQNQWGQIKQEDIF